MTVSLDGKKLLIVGGGSGIGRQLAADAAAAGASVIIAGRHNPGAATSDQPSITHAQVDLGDEASIQRLAEQVGELDYVVSLANNPANGPIVDLDRGALVGAFDAKVFGPILLVKHLAPRLHKDGAILLFSGIVGWRPSAGRVVTATTNGAVSFLAQALAVELAPIRVNALSPGIVDSGAWDAMGEKKDGFFANTAARNPTGRIGQPADITSVVLLALTNPFMTGTTLHVDGGGRLA
jgi:NAD(P)-dependent dehydrogenase (short-subunit alcohol dehydrogenase family)